MALRDILTGWLEDGLSEFGITFSFLQSQDTVPSNKPALVEMMAAFGEKYPDQGLLLVVDELLDYLRTRRNPGIGPRPRLSQRDRRSLQRHTFPSDRRHSRGHL